MSSVSGSSLDAVRRRAEARLASRRGVLVRSGSSSTSNSAGGGGGSSPRSPQSQPQSSVQDQQQSQQTKAQSPTVGGQQQQQFRGQATPQTPPPQSQTGRTASSVLTPARTQQTARPAPQAGPLTPSAELAKSQPQPQPLLSRQKQRRAAAPPSSPTPSPSPSQSQPASTSMVAPPGGRPLPSPSHAPSSTAAAPPQTSSSPSSSPPSSRGHRSPEAESAVAMADAAIASSRKVLEARSAELEEATAAMAGRTAASIGGAGPADGAARRTVAGVGGDDDGPRVAAPPPATARGTAAAAAYAGAGAVAASSSLSPPRPSSATAGGGVSGGVSVVSGGGGSVAGLGPGRAPSPVSVGERRSLAAAGGGYRPPSPGVVPSPGGTTRPPTPPRSPRVASPPRYRPPPSPSTMPPMQASPMAMGAGIGGAEGGGGHSHLSSPPHVSPHPPPPTPSPQYRQGPEGMMMRPSPPPSPMMRPSPPPSPMMMPQSLPYGHPSNQSFEVDSANNSYYRAPSTIDSSEVFPPTPGGGGGGSMAGMMMMPPPSPSPSGAPGPPHSPMMPSPQGYGPGPTGVSTTMPPPSPQRQSRAGQRTTALDLRRNDNAFQVIANVVADRLLPKVSPPPPPPPPGEPPDDGRYYDVDLSDRAFLDRMLPAEVRRNFVDALRDRAAGVTEEPIEGERAGDDLVRRCCWLGLDRADGENPLLNPGIRTVQVGFSAPVEAVDLPYRSSPYAAAGASRAARGTDRSISPAAARKYDSDSLERRRREVAKQERLLQERQEEMDRRQAEAERYLRRRQMEVRGYEAREREHRQGESAASSSPRSSRRGERSGSPGGRQHPLKNMSSLSGDTGSDKVAGAGAAAGSGPLGGSAVSGGLVGVGAGSAAMADTAARVETANSIARRQILTELREASALMANSVTPEAANFWKAHVMELQARLREVDENAVGAEQASRSVHSATPGDPAASSLTDATATAPPTKGVLPVATAASAAHGDYLPLKDSSASATEGARLQEKESMNPASSSQDRGGNYVAPNVSTTVNVAPDSMAEDAVSGGVSSAKGGSRSRKGGDSALSPVNVSSDGFPMVDVVAPADLPEGYTFEAQIGTKRFLATVPPGGGVARGEKFTCPMRDLDRVEIEVPTGKWRDGLGDCFAFGVFHPLILNTVFAPHIALGQIMARNGLTWLGRPGSRFQSKSVCTNMFIIVLFWIAMNCVAIFVVTVHVNRGLLPSGVDAVCLAAVNISMLLYTVYAVKNVRSAIRKRYGIPRQYITSGSCSGQEDLLVSVFCMPCAISQIGRHTADFDTYRAVCCSNTGLPRGVELATAPTAASAGIPLKDDSVQMV